LRYVFRFFRKKDATSAIIALHGKLNVSDKAKQLPRLSPTHFAEVFAEFILASSKNGRKITNIEKVFAKSFTFRDFLQ
jgi:hypothetical protein